MQKLSRLIKITLGPALLLLAAISVHAQAQNPSATVPIRAVVSLVGKNYTEPPKVTKDDIQVYDGKDKLTVSEWVPAQGDRGALDFAVVIDEETSTDLGLQLNDIKDFIKETPAGTRVAVFYAANGTVKIAQDFTADHEAAAKSVRLPAGQWRRVFKRLSLGDRFDEALAGDQWATRDAPRRRRHRPLPRRFSQQPGS